MVDFIVVDLEQLEARDFGDVAEDGVGYPVSIEVYVVW